MYTFEPEEEKTDIPTRHEKPFQVKKFKPNHIILNQDWEKKTKDELHMPISLDKEMNIFNFHDQNPAQNLQFEKQKEDRFDPEEFTLFKVTLDIRSGYVEPNTRMTRNTNFIRQTGLDSTIKDKYEFGF